MLKAYSYLKQIKTQYTSFKLQESMNKIICPLFITRNTRKGKKKFYLNMNNFRNWHFQVSNKLKQEFKEIISPQLEGIKYDRIDHMTYTLFYPNKIRRDKMNVVAVIDKFAMDAMVECGVIEDDNDKFVGPVTIFEPTIDKLDPRVEITIYKN